MNFPKVLYRGDRYGNTTLAEQHYTAGLYTKMIQNGNPAYITKYGIYNSIKSHIAPLCDDEFSFYNKSHFLSFSESIEIAKYYASDKKSVEMIETSKYTETRYLFTFNLEKTKIEQISKSIFIARYRCNRQLIEPPSVDTQELLVLRTEICNFCESLKFHTILILNVVSILKENPAFMTHGEALNNAVRDQEWLILPLDYVPKLYGSSANIPRADFWSTRYFRLVTEKGRDVYEPIDEYYDTYYA